MTITIIGTGYVGLVTGAGLAEMGNTVVCHVRNREHLAKLTRGVPTIYEPGLAELLKRNLREERLRFTPNLTSAIRQGDVLFIAVGTPMGRSGEADLSSVFDVARKIGRSLRRPAVVVMKSTVPVGTTERVRRIIQRGQSKSIPFSVASNPEFLREGSAVKDFLAPERIVVGVDSAEAKSSLETVYDPLVRLERPLFITDIRSAELIKYASNAFLAAKISFANELANFAEKVGADILEVTKGMGLDSRIGPRFLHAGIGYGGSCFPKDVRALIVQGRRTRSPFSIMAAVEAVNLRQRALVLQKLLSVYPRLSGTRVGVWGLSYKPKTDDVRDAPALDIIRALLDRGAQVIAFDPIAVPNAKTVLQHQALRYVSTPYAAARGVDALLLLTEWDEFRNPDFPRLKSIMRRPVLLDGRNIYRPAHVRSHGFTYFGIGRASSA